MSNEIIFSKLQLIVDQIHNIERSGFYTEKEIDSKTFPLYQELETLQNNFYSCLNKKGILGLEPFKIAECAMMLSSIKNKTNPAFLIEVVDATILTPQMFFA
jgi:hypothetical protein